jgi:hypothetical protein
MSCDRYARMIIKTGSGIPTIPPSADHRNGDWIDTDIYEGEQYQDTDTGLVYTRNGSTIVNVGASAEFKVYRANLTQTSTSAPTVDIFENTLGGTVTTSYFGLASYNLTLTGAFIANKTTIIINSGVKLGWIKAFRVSNDSIRIETYDNAFVASDAILDKTYIEIRIYA